MVIPKLQINNMFKILFKMKMEINPDNLWLITKTFSLKFQLQAMVSQ